MQHLIFFESHRIILRHNHSSSWYQEWYIENDVLVWFLLEAKSEMELEVPEIYWEEMPAQHGEGVREGEKSN